MSLTYTWKIDQVGTEDTVNNDNDVLTDAIVKVIWIKTGTNVSDVSAKYVGETVLDPSSTAAADFIALDSVTTDNVVDWLEATITDEQMAKIDATIQKRIDSQAITMRAFNN